MSFALWIRSLKTSLTSLHTQRLAQPCAKRRGILYRGGPQRRLSAALRLEQLETRLTPGYNLVTLASFGYNDAPEPTPGLVMDGSGNLYGTTPMPLRTSVVDSIFELPKGSGTLTMLAPIRSGVAGNLTIDGSGNLYGTSPFGGPSQDGSIFELVHGSSAITTLTADFADNDGRANGVNPSFGVITDGSGNLYGTTYEGGPQNGTISSSYGTVFEKPVGSKRVATLAAFNYGPTTGISPSSGLIMDGGGNLYGTTGGSSDTPGTVFEVAAGSSTITTLAWFNGASDGSPSGGLVM